MSRLVAKATRAIRSALRRSAGVDGASPQTRDAKRAFAWDAAGELAASPQVARWTRDALTPRRAPARGTWNFAAMPSAAFAGAAVLLLAIGLQAWWNAPSRGELLVGSKGLPTHAALPDGSTIILDPGARARVRFSRSGRDIELVSGHAYFIVAKDPHREFTVTSGSLSVVAVGTRFDVARVAEQTEVTLVEGRVRIEPNRAAQVAPFEMRRGTRLTAAAHGWKVEVFDTSQVEAWSHGQQVFRAARLAAVAAELNRYSDTPVVVSPDLAEERLSGVFALGDTAALADAAPSIIPGARVERASGQIRILNQ